MENIDTVPDIVAYIWRYQVQDIEGKLLTLVESLGLPERQESAVKSHVRQIVWNWYDETYVVPREVVEMMFKRDDIVKVRDRFTGVAVGSTKSL